MTCTALDGNGNLMRRVWEGERDSDGHRTWTVKHQVTSNDLRDGPATIMQCPNLPQTGDQWNFGNDIDVWAFCWPDMKVKYLQGREGEAQYIWETEQKFSTKPMHRCNVTQIENPLNEPFIISGNFVKYTQEVNHNRWGNSIRTSSMEQVHGAGVEFDFNRMQVKISWNVGTLDLPLITTFMDTVNDSVLWGMRPRCVKLSNYSFERVLYGVCTFYYKQNLEFDIDFNSFDRQLLDEGYKALHGEWANDYSDPDLTAWRNGVPLPPGSLWKLLPIGRLPPNRNNPQHYTRYKDRNGEMTRVVLDGRGEPATLAEIPAEWQPDTFYDLGTFINVTGEGDDDTGTTSQFGNVYVCSQAGISASGGTGPSGTGTNIVDGSCLWDWAYTTEQSGAPPGSIYVEYYPQSNMLFLGIPSSL